MGDDKKAIYFFLFITLYAFCGKRLGARNNGEQKVYGILQYI